MSKKYLPNEMSKAVMDELDAYFNLCVEDIQNAQKEAANWAVKELKAKSPVGQGAKSGTYAKGWKVDRTLLRTGARTIVHNKERFMLVHLLEYGHAKINGGRTRAQPHVDPTEEAANKRYEETLKRMLENDAR